MVIYSGKKSSLAFRMSLERSVLLTLAFKQRWCRVGTVTPMFATSEHMNLPVYGFLVTPEPLLGVGHIPTPGGQRFNPQLRLNEVTLFSPVWALTLWSVLFAVYLVSLVFAFCVLCWWFCSLKWLKSHVHALRLKRLCCVWRKNMCWEKHPEGMGWICIQSGVFQ